MYRTKLFRFRCHPHCLSWNLLSSSLSSFIIPLLPLDQLFNINKLTIKVNLSWRKSNSPGLKPVLKQCRTQLAQELILLPIDIGLEQVKSKSHVIVGTLVSTLTTIWKPGISIKNFLMQKQEAAPSNKTKVRHMLLQTVVQINYLKRRPFTNLSIVSKT